MKTIAVALLLLASGSDAFAQVFPQHMQRVLMCPDGTLMRDKCNEGEEVTVICVANNLMWPPRADASCHEEDAPPPQPKEDTEK